jgi:hypothetical protein
VVWVECCGFMVGEIRYSQDHWIKGGTQSSISPKVRFQSRGSIEEEEWLLVSRSSHESRKIHVDRWQEYTP